MSFKLTPITNSEDVWKVSRLCVCSERVCVGKPVRIGKASAPILPGCRIHTIITLITLITLITRLHHILGTATHTPTTQKSGGGGLREGTLGQNEKIKIDFPDDPRTPRSNQPVGNTRIYYPHNSSLHSGHLRSLLQKLFAKNALFLPPTPTFPYLTIPSRASNFIPSTDSDSSVNFTFRNIYGHDRSSLSFS
jgi:hypothetical protein